MSLHYCTTLTQSKHKNNTNCKFNFSTVKNKTLHIDTHRASSSMAVADGTKPRRFLFRNLWCCNAKAGHVEPPCTSVTLDLQNKRNVCKNVNITEPNNKTQTHLCKAMHWISLHTLCTICTIMSIKKNSKTHPHCAISSINIFWKILNSTEWTEVILWNLTIIQVCYCYVFGLRWE